MSDTKTRGRPKTGNAMSSTERSRLLHERAERVYETAFHPGRPLRGIADSVLLLAFQNEYRQAAKERSDDPAPARLPVRIVRELLLRLGVDSTALASLEAHYGIEPETINPVESTDNDSVETTITETPLTVESTDSHPAVNPVETTINTLPTITVESTDNQLDGITVDATDNPAPFTLAPATPTEPVSARDAEILALHAAGVSKRQIARQLGYKSDNSVRRIIEKHCQREESAP